MWNIRGIFRQFGGRLKSPCGVQTTKECTEAEEEYYKQLWSPQLWKEDGHLRYRPPNKQYLRSLPSEEHHDGGQGYWDNQRRSEWDASAVHHRTWLEAIGWGAFFGLGLNVLHAKQDLLVRRQGCVSDKDPCGVARYLARCALSMPFANGQEALVKHVLPSSHSLSERFSEEALSDCGSSSRSADTGDVMEPTSSYEEDPKRVSYTSEQSAFFSLARQQLTEATNDYIDKLTQLLGFASGSDKQHGGSRSSVEPGQSQFTLGLFSELGIGTQRNNEQALRHYIEAAQEGHPVAIENVASFRHFSGMTNPKKMQRSFSSPVLSQQSSGFFEESPVESPSVLESTARRPSRFWADGEDDSGHQDVCPSRSSSFPDLPRIVACK